MPFKIPRRVYEAIRVVAETYGGIGSKVEFTTVRPSTTVDFTGSAPFCWWGCARTAIKEHLISDFTDAESLRSIFPSESENDKYVTKVPDSEKTPDGRVPFEKYVKDMDIVCVPD